MRTAIAVVLALLESGLAVAEPICDDAWTIRPHQLQAQSFALTKEATVTISLAGVKNAEKGFAVHIVPADLWDSFRAGHATFKAIQDASTEHARFVNRSSQLKAGRWAVIVENDQNVIEQITVHARIAIEDPVRDAKQSSTGRRPEKEGECVETSVTEVGFRLSVSGVGVAGSGSEISYSNGLGQVDYKQEPGADESRPGDKIRLCLVSIPKRCPPGDERGKVYKATNQRTGKSWTMSNSQHSCGGA
jgi:hypothetical protein